MSDSNGSKNIARENVQFLVGYSVSSLFHAEINEIRAALIKAQTSAKAAHNNLRIVVITYGVDAIFFAAIPE